MFHFVYKTVHIGSGKYYIGKHSTLDVNDGYLGSGKRLKQAINKYGRDAFVREILICCKTALEALECEEEILAKHLNDPFCINLKFGGQGGFEYINEGLQKQHYINQRLNTWYAKDEKLRAISNKKKSRKGTQNGMYGISRKGIQAPFYGHKHSDKTKETLSKARKGTVVVFDTTTGNAFVVSRLDPRLKTGELTHINKGRKATAATRRTLSDTRKRLNIVPPSPKGKLWWNDGKTQKRATVCPGDGWQRGRLK